MAPTAPKTAVRKKAIETKRDNPVKKTSTAAKSLAPSYRKASSSQVPTPAGSSRNPSKAPTQITGAQSRRTSVSDEVDDTPSHIGGVLADDDAVMRD
jgi:hypothetical protein